MALAVLNIFMKININQIIILLLAIFMQSKANAQVSSFVIDSSKFTIALLPALDTIYQDDQSYRISLGKMNKNRIAKNEIDSIKNIIQKKDSINLVKVNEIIERYGWLGPQEVGMNGSQAIFLVIQHSDLATQKKYLPLIIKAEKDGKTLSSNLAILKDRIAMRQGKKQLYGSQGFKDQITGKNYVYPIADVDNLEQRRKVMGMPPMKEYVTTWDLEAYKKELFEIEKIVKAQKIH